MALVRKEGGDIQRFRRQAAFDRMLCRFFQNEASPWLPKGGYAMELRIRTASTTRDIDLALRQSSSLPSEWNIEVVARRTSKFAGEGLGGFSIVGRIWNIGSLSPAFEHRGHVPAKSHSSRAVGVSASSISLAIHLCGTR